MSGVVPCGHKGCLRPAVIVMAMSQSDDDPKDGQTHDCCGHHQGCARYLREGAP